MYTKVRAIEKCNLFQPVTEFKHSWENVKRSSVYYLENPWSIGFRKEQTLLRLEISIRPDFSFFFFSVHNNLYLINLSSHS